MGKVPFSARYEWGALYKAELQDGEKLTALVVPSLGPSTGAEGSVGEEELCVCVRRLMLDQVRRGCT